MLLDLLPQCCDARQYLVLGETCATGTDCYHILRPMGAVYWFSLPYRFGFGGASVIYLHGLLAMLSIYLSCKALLRWISEAHAVSLEPRSRWALIILSVLIHAVFLYPTWRHSLSDPPSALIFLIALWLLWLAPYSRASWFLFLVAGLLLGTSAWIRAFFLYPVLTAIAIVLFWLAITRRLTAPYLFLLAALIPIGSQYYATWARSHTFTYIDPSESEIHHGLIMTERATGYDTVLPGVGIRWYPPCEEYQAMGDALQGADIFSMACLLTGKLHYYLGSYSSTTFWNPAHGTVMDALPVDVNATNNAQLVALKDDTQTLYRFEKIAKERSASLSHSLHLAPGFKYFISFKAWADDPAQIIMLSVKNAHNGMTRSAQMALLDTAPQAIRVGVILHHPEDLVWTIDHPYVDPQQAEARPFTERGISINKGSFYISDLHLEQADFRDERSWHPMILILNIAAWICVTGFFIVYRKTLHPGHGLAGLVILLCCGQALLITPEQRFIIAPMIFAWLFCITFIGLTLRRRTLSP